MSPPPVPALSAVLDRIRAWASANKLKPATLARQAGLAEVVTRDLDQEDWSPSSRSIRRLEALIPPGWKAGDPVNEPDATDATAIDAALADFGDEGGGPGTDPGEHAANPPGDAPDRAGSAAEPDPAGERRRARHLRLIGR